MGHSDRSETDEKMMVQRTGCQDDEARLCSSEQSH